MTSASASIRANSARIASFSSVVADLSASDRVAGNILDKAAAHLSEAVQAAIRRVHLSGPQPPRVVAVGRNVDHDMLVAPASRGDVPG